MTAATNNDLPKKQRFKKSLVLYETCRISKEVLDQCRTVAQQEGRTLGGLVNMWLHMKLREREREKTKLEERYGHKTERDDKSGGYRT